jgi:hypothetical protein
MRCGWWAVVGLLLSLGAARAQDTPFSMNPGAYSNAMSIPPMMERLERSHRTVFGNSTKESLKGRRSLQGQFDPDGMSKRRGAGAMDPVSTVVSGGVSGAFATKLAQNYSAETRPEAERVFQELLKGYEKIERQFGIPRHDVAGSVAAFVAGSWMAYRNSDFPDENFKPLVGQVRQIISTNPDFAQASEGEKREMYEQMAILGMFMATTQMALKDKPNPQLTVNMKQAAKGYLEQFLKTDADRVQLTARGLMLR